MGIRDTDNGANHLLLTKMLLHRHRMVFLLLCVACFWLGVDGMEALLFLLYEHGGRGRILA
jgi:hypothetical protein